MEFPTRRRFFLEVIKHALHWASEASHRMHLFLILLAGALFVLLAIRLEEYKWVIAIPFFAFVGAFLFALFDYTYSLCRNESEKRLKAQNESDQRIAELEARLKPPEFITERTEVVKDALSKLSTEQLAALRQLRIGPMPYNQLFERLKKIGLGTVDMDGLKNNTGLVERDTGNNIWRINPEYKDILERLL